MKCSKPPDKSCTLNTGCCPHPSHVSLRGVYRETWPPPTPGEHEPPMLSHRARVDGHTSCSTLLATCVFVQRSSLAFTSCQNILPCLLSKGYINLQIL